MSAVADHTARLLLRPDGVFRAVCSCSWTSDDGHAAAADRHLAALIGEAVTAPTESLPRRIVRRAYRKA